MSENLIIRFDDMNVPKALMKDGDCVCCDEFCNSVDSCTDCPLQKIFDKLAAYEAKERNDVENVTVEPDEPKTKHSLRLTVEFNDPISFDEAKQLISNAINTLKG